MDLTNAKIHNEHDLPESMTRGKYDYTELVKLAKTLTPGKVITVPIEKPHQASNIRDALTRPEKSRKYRVSLRTLDGQKNALIRLARGHK